MLAIVFSLLLAPVQTVQETTTPPDKPAEKQECQVSGQVVTQDGGHPLKSAKLEPVGGATVILSMTPTAPVKSKKDGRRYRVENVVKGGAFFAPFISTLDNIFNAHTIERGLKRSAFG